MKVKEIMTPGVICVGEEEPVTAAARLLKRYNVGALPVCDEAGCLTGMVTDRDIVVRCVAAGENPEQMHVGKIMSYGVMTVKADDTVDESKETMAKWQVRRLPVLEDGKVVGMVALADMAKRSACSMEAAQALCDISKNIRRV